MARRGTKAAQYQAAGLRYGPPGAPFETLGEPGDVFGMTPALLAALTPHLTLCLDGDPDPAMADPVVRVALRDAGYGERARIERPCKPSASPQQPGAAPPARSAAPLSGSARRRTDAPGASWFGRACLAGEGAARLVVKQSERL